VKIRKRRAVGVEQLLEPVKQLGDELLCHCPFPDHLDETPSFYFNVESGLFHCFACGKGGTVRDLERLFGVEGSLTSRLEFLSSRLQRKPKQQVALTRQAAAKLLVQVCRDATALASKFRRWEAESVKQAVTDELDYVFLLLDEKEISAMEAARWARCLKERLFAAEQTFKTGGYYDGCEGS